MLGGSAMMADATCLLLAESETPITAAKIAAEVPLANVFVYEVILSLNSWSVSTLVPPVKADMLETVAPVNGAALN
jgi:hypothetical protein